MPNADAHAPGASQAGREALSPPPYRVMAPSACVPHQPGYAAATNSDALSVKPLGLCGRSNCWHPSGQGRRVCVCVCVCVCVWERTVTVL